LAPRHHQRSAVLDPEALENALPNTIGVDFDVRKYSTFKFE
jgi:hypothetical protein